MTIMDLFNQLAEKDFIFENGNLVKIFNGKKYYISKNEDKLSISHPVVLTQNGLNNFNNAKEEIKQYFLMEDARVSNNKVEFLTSNVSDFVDKEEMRLNNLISKIDETIYGDPSNIDQNNMLNAQKVEVWEKAYSVKGVLGALIGAILGAIIIAALSAVGYVAAISGFIGGILIIFLYRKFSGNDIPVVLLIIFILLMVLLGNSITLAIPLMKEMYFGALDALLEGILSHFRTQYYEQSKVLSMFFMKLVFAIIGSIGYFKQNNKPEIK